MSGQFISLKHEKSIQIMFRAIKIVTWLGCLLLLIYLFSGIVENAFCYYKECPGLTQTECKQKCIDDEYTGMWEQEDFQSLWEAEMDKHTPLLGEDIVYDFVFRWRQERRLER